MGSARCRVCVRAPGKMTAFSPPSLVCPVLVGRETQIGVLDRLIDQASRRGGSTALITGEAGVGKSRLVAEIMRRVHRERRGGGAFSARRLPGPRLEPGGRVADPPPRDLPRP